MPRPQRRGKRNARRRVMVVVPRPPRVSFNTRVMQALQITAERKIAKSSSLANLMDINITDSTVYPIMPSIRQGVQGGGARVGNEIRLKKLVIKGYMAITPSVQTTASNGAFQGRLMILRQRNHSGSAIVADNTLFQFNDLMEYDQPYTGQPNNYLQSVNSNSFVSRRDKKFRFTTATNYQTDDPESPSPDAIKYFSITLTFGKQGKKLLYKDDLINNSTNFPYFMVAAIHNSEGSPVTGTPVLNYYTEATYTDI